MVPSKSLNVEESVSVPALTTIVQLLPSNGPDQVSGALTAYSKIALLLVTRCVPNSELLAVRTSLPPSMSIGVPMPFRPAIS